MATVGEGSCPSGPDMSPAVSPSLVPLAEAMVVRQEESMVSILGLDVTRAAETNKDCSVAMEEVSEDARAKIEENEKETIMNINEKGDKGVDDMKGSISRTDEMEKIAERTRKEIQEEVKKGQKEAENISDSAKNRIQDLFINAQDDIAGSYGKFQTNVNAMAEAQNTSNRNSPIRDVQQSKLIKVFQDILNSTRNDITTTKEEFKAKSKELVDEAEKSVARLCMERGSAEINNIITSLGESRRSLIKKLGHAKRQTMTKLGEEGRTARIKLDMKKRELIQESQLHTDSAQGLAAAPVPEEEEFIPFGIQASDGLEADPDVEDPDVEDPDQASMLAPLMDEQPEDSDLYSGYPLLDLRSTEPIVDEK